MNNGKVFAVLGGDLRQAHLASLMANQGYNVNAFFFDNDIELSGKVKKPTDFQDILPSCDVVIMPLPISTDSVTVNTPFSLCKILVEDCFRHMKEHALVFCGQATPAVYEYAQKYSVTVIDYLKREELAILNAVPTAEGAVALAMQETLTTIFGQKCMITGFGRVAKTLARILVAMGASVTIACRRCSDMAWAQVLGCHVVHISTIREAASEMDILFNTIPTVILDKETLSRLQKHCLVIDLASKPGGVDFEAAKTLGIKVIWALSLPGKVAPFTAGKIIKDTILNILEERGEA